MWRERRLYTLVLLALQLGGPGAQLGQTGTLAGAAAGSGWANAAMLDSSDGATASSQLQLLSDVRGVAGGVGSAARLRGRSENQHIESYKKIKVSLCLSL